jgi:hypothetical protein
MGVVIRSIYFFIIFIAIFRRYKLAPHSADPATLRELPCVSETSTRAMERLSFGPAHLEDLVFFIMPHDVEMLYFRAQIVVVILLLPTSSSSWPGKRCVLTFVL